MTIEEQLLVWLNTPSNSKLWPLVMPEGFEDFPGCTYQRVKDFHPSDGDGVYGALGYLVRLVVWGDEFGSVRDMSELLRGELNNERITHFITITDSDDGIDPTTLMFRNTLDVEIIELVP